MSKCDPCNTHYVPVPHGNPTGYFLPFGYFNDYTPVIPKFYYDVYSLEEREKHICKILQKLMCYADYLAESLNTERDERIAADEQLQANIDAESEARQQADERLQANIDAEKQARIAGDNRLQANVDAEKQARQQADAQLQANIDAEKQARIAGDNRLQANIDAEATARQQADTQLQANIDAEATARQQADAQLQSEIDELNECCKEVRADIDALEVADGQLSNRIDAEESARVHEDDLLWDAIRKEQRERANADAVLQANIDAEASARESADTALDGRVTELEECCETVKNKKSLRWRSININNSHTINGLNENNSSIITVGLTYVLRSFKFIGLGQIRCPNIYEIICTNFYFNKSTQELTLYLRSINTISIESIEILILVEDL